MKKILGLLAVPLLIFIGYFVYFGVGMSHDFPAYGVGRLVDFYEYQMKYKDSFRLFDTAPSLSAIKTRVMDAKVMKSTTKIYLPNSEISKKYCLDCKLTRNDFKVISIEKFKTRAYYSVYSIDSNKEYKLIKRIDCEECLGKELKEIKLNFFFKSTE